MSFFSVKNLSAGYQKHTILSDISFHIDDGCMVGILGANGSGKTTLLKAICGIIPHTGKCELHTACFEQLSPKELAKLCSYIPQRSGITIDISVLDVVLMGFHPHLNFLSHPNKDMIETAIHTLKLVGLSGREQENYMYLSEGQKQLCILARTLVAKSKLLLLDEPESALDFHFRHQMLELLRSWNKKTHSSSLITLHDPMLALNYCDKLLLLSNGHIFDTIHPSTDSLDKMEHALSLIYGTISLHHCNNRNGEKRIVMLKEKYFESKNENHIL